ncbi:MAG: hypothetical protein IJX17_07030 [Clostridia bacterium]|nr:hypothetical protein [Clostridia bacterium]
MQQTDTNLFENCIKNYAMPIWENKLEKYYPKEEAKRYIEKLHSGISYSPSDTYITMVNNLGYLDLISNGKSKQMKIDLIEKFSKDAPNFRDTLSNHEMLLYSNYSSEILPIIQNILSPHKEAKDLLNYLKRFEVDKRKNA